jgi:hypothetical protein
MVKNGIYSFFVIWGQIWASHLLLVSLQYPSFSNLQRCLSFLKGMVTGLARAQLNPVNSLGMEF